MDILSLRERRSDSVMTVSELNCYVKNLLESDRLLGAVTVKGEISNFIYHRSGHLYFSLKDEDGQIKAVMFRSSAARLKFMPENGMKVTVHGSVNIYTKDGSIQLYVNQMQPDGIGALYLAYEQMKERLYREGLFNVEHKKPIPKMPIRVGVITSPTGAAIRDIINVLGRRFPLATVYLYPSLVQGDEASTNLVEAVDYFDNSNLVDVVIIGRGGGSLEDLWAFNNETLARRIFDAKVPIISAVGHETDFTICDFVADLRAPTPSAAAELAVPDIREIYLRIGTLTDEAYASLAHACDKRRHALDLILQRASLKDSRQIFENKRKALADLEKQALICISNNIKDCGGKLDPLAQKLNALSPLATMRRGFAVATKNGSVVKSIADVEVDDDFTLRLSDGVVTARITTKG